MNFLYLLLFLFSLEVSLEYDNNLWKPIAISTLIYSFVYILCNYNFYQNLNFVSIGLLGYISGILYNNNYNECASLILLVTFIYCICDINYNLIVGKIMTLLIVLALTILIQSHNYILDQTSLFIKNN